MYPAEVLDSEEDDGTMVESREALADAVVGHRIVAVEKQNPEEARYHYGYGDTYVIKLDNGTQVRVVGQNDCCAYAEIEQFLLHADKIDHIITGVGTTDQYETWHIFADFGDVLELKVGWSCGNPFYYAYGFSVTVEPLEET